MRSLLKYLMSLGIAVWPVIAAPLDDEVPPPRVIHGGLGYSFTMAPPAPGDPQYLRPIRGQESNVVRAQVDEDFFPERELHFTVKTGELLKIEGRRRSRGSVALTRDECGRDWQLVVDTLREKYPTLELITEPAPAPAAQRSQLCEGSRRLPGDSRLIGTGRCIRLECTPTIEDRAMLAITYWNNDIFSRAQREEQEQRDESLRRLGAERGLDPSKL